MIICLLHTVLRHINLKRSDTKLLLFCNYCINILYRNPHVRHVTNFSNFNDNVCMDDAFPGSATFSSYQWSGRGG